MGGPWVAELEALNEVVLLAALAHTDVLAYLAEVRCGGACHVLRGVCHVSSRCAGRIARRARVTCGLRHRSSGRAARCSAMISARR